MVKSVYTNIVFIILFPLLSFSQSINDNIDVSTSGVQNGQTLIYNGKGFGVGVPSSTPDISSTSPEQLLYNSADTVAGNDNLSYDGTILNVEGSLNPRLKVYRSSGGAAYISLGNTSNQWDWYCNGINSGFEPLTANGTFYFRNLANVQFFDIKSTTSAGLLEVKNGGVLRITSKGGTGVSLAGYDAEEDLTNLTLGGNLSISSGVVNTLSSAVSPSDLTSNTNNYSPSGLDSNYEIAFGSTSAVDLTGLSETGIDDGTKRLLRNTGSFTINIPHQDGSSLTGNQFVCPGGTTYALLSNAAIEIVLTTDGWQIIGN